MRRKIIRQGNNSYTFTLPKKWIEENSLSEGEELSIDEEGGKLMISPANELKKEAVPVEIDVRELLDSNIRTVIGNAYRLGYDKIIVKYEGDNQLKAIKNQAKENLIGFDAIESKPGVCVLESIAEPSLDNFDKMINKIFHLIAEMQNLNLEYFRRGKADVEEILVLVNQVHAYDNFCRRVMSKKKITEKRSHFYWILVSLLAHIGRETYYMDVAMAKHKIKPSKECIELLMKEREVFALLSKAYMGKTIEPIKNIHEIEKNIIYGKGYKTLSGKGKDHILVHHLLSIIRNSYFAGSPIYGILLS